MRFSAGTLLALLTVLGISAAATLADDVALSATPTPTGMDLVSDWQTEPVWRCRANMVLMRLSQPNNNELVADFLPGGIELLNAAELGCKYEFGGDVSLWRQINDVWNVEGRFLRVDGWSSTRSPTFAWGSLVEYDPSPPGFKSPYEYISAAVGASYRAELNSFEVNGRRRINDFWSLLLGFRYLGINDNLQIVQDVGPGYRTWTHNVRALNDLFGFQAGADMALLSRGNLSFEGLFKAGVYGNAGANSVDITAPQTHLTYHTNASTTQAAFVGELGITAVYRFNRNLSVRGGYQFLWLEGIAQAPDQVTVSNPLAGTASVSLRGTPSYDGAFVGLEYAR
jgi:hypothetical protein